MFRLPNNEYCKTLKNFTIYIKITEEKVSNMNIYLFKIEGSGDNLLQLGLLFHFIVSENNKYLNNQKINNIDGYLNISYANKLYFYAYGNT